MAKLGAINVAAITPHRDTGYQADLGATLELVDYLGAAGVHGIALLGSTGEFTHLSFEDRAHLIKLAAKRSRVPIIAGVTHSTLDGTIWLAEDAVHSGAAAVLVMPPYFFQYEASEIREFFLQLSSRLGSSVPVILYNIPLFTSAMPVETSCDLLATGKFAGIKDSSGNFDDFSRLLDLKRSTPFTLLVGSDTIYTKARCAGADGIVSGVACAIPELLLALDAAILACDGPKTQRLEARLQQILKWLFRFPAPVGVKAACEARKLKVGPMAVPLSAEKARELDEFRAWLRDCLPEILQECAA